MAWNIRQNPFFPGRVERHDGIDLPYGMNEMINAKQDGVIKRISNDPNGYGNFVDILHDDGTTGRYAHAGIISRGEGQRVKRGDEIGLAGSTGRSTGPHLHFEHRDQNDKPIDPRGLLATVGGRAPTQFATGPQAAPTQNYGGPNMTSALPRATGNGAPPAGLEDYVRQAQSLIPQAKPTPELMAMLQQQAQRRVNNLPLALGAMLSGDRGLSVLGGSMYKDAQDGNSPQAIGDEGYFDPRTGQFVRSPIGEVNRNQKMLEIASRLSQQAQDTYMREQAAQAQREFTNQIAIQNLRLSQINTQRGVDTTSNTFQNEGVTPSQAANGAPASSPTVTGNILTTPPVVGVPTTPAPRTSALPLATTTVQPQIQGTVLPLATAPTQPPVVQAPAPIVQPQNSTVTVEQGQANQTSPDQGAGVRNFIPAIGLNPTRVGRAADGSGDIYSGPQGGEYILHREPGSPNDGKFYLKPQDTVVIKDRQVLPADKVLEISTGYKDAAKLAETAATFKPEFGGAKLDQLGAIQNWLGTRDSNSKYAEQAQWWQNWQTYFNGVIKTLSGSAVTEGEARRLAATAITPGMDPAYIQTRVAEIQRDAAKALNMLRDSLDKQGFGVEGFQILPESAPTNRNAPAPTITRESR
jgi:hypothetical protein